jgi:small subunit ribosomal protein S20
VANIKSQIKRNRQNDKKRLRNRVYRSEARIAVRNARTNIDDGVPTSKESLQQAFSSLDKAVEQGVIHKNNAARRKSRLMKAFNKMSPTQATAEPSTVEQVLEATPVAVPSAGKKAAPRRAGRKAVEPLTDEAVEPKVEPKKKSETRSASKSKASASKAAPKEKKPAAKKTSTSTSAAEKKPTTRKKASTAK